MNAEEKGRSLAHVLRSVRNLHEDCTRLISDLDSWMEGERFSWLGDNIVASGFSYSRRNAMYLANVLFSRWKSLDDDCLIRTVNIILFEKDHDWIDQPYLVATQLKYLAIPTLKELEMAGWDSWGETSMVLGEAYRLDSRALKGRISDGATIAVGLASLDSLENVVSLFSALSLCLAEDKREA